MFTLLASLILSSTFLSMLSATGAMSTAVKLGLQRSTQTLLVATRRDEASLNIYNHLRLLPVWEKIPTIPPSSTTSEESGEDEVVMFSKTITGSQVFLWLQNNPLLGLDFVNVVFDDRMKSFSTRNVDYLSIDDVFFLSKHSAASGTRSLTVHPIGIPWLTEEEVPLIRTTNYFLSAITKSLPRLINFFYKFVCLPPQISASFPTYSTRHLAMVDVQESAVHHTQ